MYISRPLPGDRDIKMEVMYCGICHSDCTIGLDMMGTNQWPFIPGHEFIGRVVQVGKKVKKVKVGDNVGVGCYVDKCDTCEDCLEKEESFCPSKVISINAKKTGKRVGGNPDTYTHGGYGATHVVNEDFAFKIPGGMNLAEAAPILCGGITMFSPLKHWGCLEGKKMTVGIVGIGGLGTLGIKLANAMGHDVMAISTTSSKEKLAKQKGAHLFCASTDPESVKANAAKCDLVINTVSANHDLNAYLPLLRRDGVIVQIGVAMSPHPIMQYVLMRNRLTVSGSVVGSLAEHQEVLEFCHKHKITSDVTLVEAEGIDKAWEELNGKNKDAIRYVIDIKKSLKNKSFMPTPTL